jgi:putative alpha-1,2-mannosidase
VAKNNSTVNKYIGSVTLNGKPCNKLYIDFKDIAAGGELVFEMSHTP